jgi:hypothetical protein
VARVRVKVPVEPKPTEPVKSEVEPPSEAAGPAKSHKAPIAVPLKGEQIKKLALVAALLFLTVFMIRVIQDRNSLQEQLSVNSPQAQSQEEAEELVRQISVFVELPANEVPRLITVTDSQKTIEQYPALSDLKDGDKMLLYPNSRKLVVYRPATKKVVTVVTLSPVEDEDSASPTQ